MPGTWWSDAKSCVSIQTLKVNRSHWCQFLQRPLVPERTSGLYQLRLMEGWKILEHSCGLDALRATRWRKTIETLRSPLAGFSLANAPTLSIQCSLRDKLYFSCLKSHLAPPCRINSRVNLAFLGFRIITIFQSSSRFFSILPSLLSFSCSSVDQRTFFYYY